MGIGTKLLAIQQKLKAPKDKPNTFGGYKYRSAENILEAVKPLLAEQNCILMLTDSIEMLGNRYYVAATARLVDVETGENIEISAYAREAEFKKGMDDSQITGTASSYARKYAMNGLFAIDDTKDADTNEYREEREARYQKQTGKIDNPRGKISDTDAKIMKDRLIAKNCDTGKLLAIIERETGYEAKSIDSLTREQYVLADALIKKYYPDEEEKQ